MISDSIPLITGQIASAGDSTVTIRLSLDVSSGVAHVCPGSCSYMRVRVRGDKEKIKINKIKKRKDLTKLHDDTLRQHAGGGGGGRGGRGGRGGAAHVHSECNF